MEPLNETVETLDELLADIREQSRMIADALAQATANLQDARVLVSMMTEGSPHAMLGGE